MNPPPVSLLLLASLILVSAPARAIAKEPDNAVDHAGILQSLDEESHASGKTIYKTLCVNCHGADGITPPLPIARAFGRDELKFGTDPYSMFLTLTNGNGLMGPQTWMTPEERYNVIHYIREEFMRPMRDDFEEINDGYLEALPTVNVVVKESDKLARDFGPALASQLGRDISSVLTVKLTKNTTISYNLHTMDQAGLWTGGFLNLLSTQHYRERGGGVPEPQGDPVDGLQVWRWAHDGSLDYPTDDLLPRGPIPAPWLDYKGHYLHNNRVILSYAIDGRDILEMPSKPRGFGAIDHTLEIAPGNPLKLAVGQLDEIKSPSNGFLNSEAKTFQLTGDGPIAVLGDTENDTLGRFLGAAVIGDTDGLQWSFDDQNRLVLEIPATDHTKLIQIIRFAGKGEGNLLSFATYLRSTKFTKKTAPPPLTTRPGWGTALAPKSSPLPASLATAPCLTPSTPSVSLPTTTGIPTTPGSALPPSPSSPMAAWSYPPTAAIFGSCPASTSPLKTSTGIASPPASTNPSASRSSTV